MLDYNALPHRLSVLGATGSIGQNTLDVIEHLGGRDRFDIISLTGMSNIESLANQARHFGVQFVATADQNRYHDLKDALSGTNIEVGAGADAIVEAAARDSEWVMAGIVGMAGLAPTLTAARRGADIALANKECLVAGGEYFKSEVQKGGGKLLPADSEHSAIFQVLDAHQSQSIDKIILTASGGPYRKYTLDEMASVSVESAASHPNWSMGLKISIDSASMFNKALEMIEAQHLFDVSPQQIDVVVHPQSIIHSLVSYLDGSVLAQLGSPDMRTALGYTLTYPYRADLPVERLDLVKLAQLDFEAPDEVRFPALRLARRAMIEGGLSGAVLNGAKEVALEAFIAGQIGFLQMAEIVERVMDDMSGIESGPESSICETDIFNADGVARTMAKHCIEQRSCVSA